MSWQSLKIHVVFFPLFQVGTQIDLRDDAATIDKLAKNKQKPLSLEAGEKLAKELRAVKYVECSALTQVSVWLVLRGVISYLMICPSLSLKRFWICPERFGPDPKQLNFTSWTIYHTRAIISRSWIQAIHKDRIFWKKLLKNKEMEWHVWYVIFKIILLNYLPGREVNHFFISCESR